MASGRGHLGRAHRRRAGTWVAVGFAWLLAAAAAQPAAPPSPASAMAELDTIATAGGRPNATDAALAAAATAAGVDGVPGYVNVQCGGSFASATLNGTNFGAPPVRYGFGAGGGPSTVGVWPDRTCPADAATCGQAPVPPNWPPTLKETGCFLCGDGALPPALLDDGAAAARAPSRCLTTARAQAAGGWPRVGVNLDGVAHGTGTGDGDGLGDERRSGADWRCIGDAAHLFYWMQSSGPLSEAARRRVGPWRGDTLLADAAPNGAPLVGSFLDAADVSKFVLPLAYTVSMLSYGAFVGPARDSYGADRVRRADLLAIVDHAARFLKATRYAPGAIVAYTTAPGSLNASHAGFWGRAEDITVPSDVGYLRPGLPSADLAGAVAAALAGAAYAMVDDDVPTETQLEAAAEYVATAADLFEQGEKFPGLHTPYVDATLPLFYNSTSYHDDMALAGVWLALMTGGADWNMLLRSGYGSAHRYGGHDADEAADLVKRANALADAAGTARLRSAEEYWDAANAHLRAFLSSKAAQTNLLSWDNVGTLASNVAGRLAYSSLVPAIRAAAVANFSSPADMVDFYTKPAQLAVLSWMATAKNVPSRVVGPLPGFGTKTEYLAAGNLAIAYDNAWGSSRLLTAATALALDLADLSAAMDKYDRRQAWRCWARSQARALVGRVPGRSRPYTDSRRSVNETAAAPRADGPGPTLWRSFVVGVGPSPPRFLSHRGASCPADRALPCDCGAYVSPSPNPTTLYGALVGGPNRVAANAPGFHGYQDDRSSYETNEPALDYNAGWLITTMALAGTDVHADARSPDSLSTFDRQYPVSMLAATADADTWDACVDSGVGTFPTLPAAFVADVRNASARNIDASRFKPTGAGVFHDNSGWKLDGLLLAAAFGAAVAAYHAACSIAAACGKRSHRQLWYDGAVRLAAARDDARMLGLLRALAADRERGRGLRFDAEAPTPGLGFTALLAAAAGASPGGGDAVEWLLARGANPRAVKDDGWRDTALHYAAAAGGDRAAAALLAAAPDLAAAVNFAGRTPADVARANGHGSLAELLASAAADAPAAPADPAPRPAAPQADEEAAAPPPSASELAEAAAFAARGRDGWGSPGTRPMPGLTLFRVFAVLASAAWLGYLMWRALRTLDTTSTALYTYSVVFWLTEAFGFVMWFPLVISLWRQVDRQPRNLHRMLLPPGVADNASARAAHLAIIAAPPSSASDGGDGDSGGGGGGGGGGGESGVHAAASRDSLVSLGGAAAAYPTAALLVTCYSEPVDVIQPTVLAALMQDYPADRVRVCVCCDDPKRADVPAMVRKLQRYCAATPRALPQLDCVVRPKVAGVAHHAKAGNVNSALFAAGVTEDYVVVLDCDMVTDPKFLARTLAHFFERDPAAPRAASPRTSGMLPPVASVADRSTAPLPPSLRPGNSAAFDAESAWWAAAGAPGAVKWRRKARAGFLQTPQSFVNVDADDVLGHRSRLFYGPLQAGRDGADAVCCCGTGCVFDRAALVSVGGQSYGSITEDNNTSQDLAAAGFSSMYLDERLQAGLAPDDIPGVFQQRQRWATGALQIWWRANPLRRGGMTFVQRVLYYDTSAYPLLGVTTLILCLVPIVYLLSGYTPFNVRAMSGLLIAFGLFYVLQRAALWMAHLQMDGGTTRIGVAGAEMLRTTQVGFWLAPCNVRALTSMLWAEAASALTGGRAQTLGFNVTKKKVAVAGGGGGGDEPKPAAAPADPPKPPRAAAGPPPGDVELGGVAPRPQRTVSFNGDDAAAAPPPPGPPPAKAAAAAPARARWTHAMLRPALLAARASLARPTSPFREALPYVWMHLTYFVLLAAAVGVTIWRAVTGMMDAWAVAVTATAMGWAVLVGAQLWPPLSLLAPDFGVRARLARAGTRMTRIVSRRSSRAEGGGDGDGADASAETVLGSTHGGDDAASKRAGGGQKVGAFSDALRQASVLGKSTVGGLYSLAPSAASVLVFAVDLWVVGALVAAAVIDARRVDVLLGSAGFNWAG